MPGGLTRFTFASSTYTNMTANFSISNFPAIPERNCNMALKMRDSVKSYIGEIQNPALVLAFVHLLLQEPPKNNRLPRKVRYFSFPVRILRPQTRAMVGVLKVEVGIPRL
jgi:hypothetical protein